MIKYFGTDGIRGEAGVVLTAEMAFLLGQSLKKVLDTQYVVIGRDTRLSSDALAYSVAAGAMSVGIDVMLAGVITTPMLAHYSKTKKVTGIMITASHNPYYDNGIKVLEKGTKINEHQEKAIESFLDEPTPQHTKDFGVLLPSEDITKDYLKIYNALEIEKSTLRIGYDAANGAATYIAQDVFSQISHHVSAIHINPNGKNINLQCGSTHLEAILALVKKEQLDLGFSFDGDGDRCLAVDKNQYIYDGDLLVYSIAKYLKAQNALNHNTVVLTQMSNPGIVKALKNLGIDTVRTRVGDKYVSAEMTKNNYVLGGENSGHIILKHLLHTGDGLLVAAVILNILEKEKVSLKTWTQEVTLYPQKMINISDVSPEVLHHPAVVKTLERVKKALGDEGLLLVRPSGTEPLIRVTVSHKESAIMEKHLDQLVSLIKDVGKEFSQ